MGHEAVSDSALSPVSAIGVVVASAVTVLTTIATGLPALRQSPLYGALGLVFVLFIPGYALWLALTPRSSTEGLELETLLHVLGLSVATAIFATTLVGVSSLPYPVIGIQIVLSVLTSIALAAAVWRHNIGKAELIQEWQRVTDTVGGRNPRSLRQRIRSVNRLTAGVSIVSLLATCAVLGLLLQTPASYTEMALLEQRPDGESVAAGTDSPLNETDSLMLRVENTGQHRQDYTVSVSGQVISEGSVIEQRTLDRFQPTVAPRDTWTVNQTLPSADRIDRVVFSLYTTPDPSPQSDPAQTLHVWLSPREADRTDGSRAANVRILSTIRDSTTTIGNRLPVREEES